MGACLSAISGGSSNESVSRRRPSCANVISTNGNLRQYTIPITVSHVLRMEFETNTTPISSSSSSDSTTSNIIKSSSTSDKFFVCNSEHLYYDDYIPALDGEDQLQADQIYFLLPVSKLNYRLTASDMAALAVKASLALEKSSSNKKKKAAAPSSSSSSSSTIRRNRSLKQNKMARISPFLEEEELVNTNNYTITNNQRQRVVPHSGGGGDKPAGVGVLRSSSFSVSKLQRYSSKRAKTAVRSFRIRLTTIYEGSILQF